jgi:iron complex outermembrane recepter protein
VWRRTVHEVARGVHLRARLLCGAALFILGAGLEANAQQPPAGQEPSTVQPAPTEQQQPPPQQAPVPPAPPATPPASSQPSTTLPPVQVEVTTRPRTSRQAAPAQTRAATNIRAPQAAAPAAAPSLSTQPQLGQSAWGPVQGYVATNSATGTKTDTPIIETPQSISVVTRDQMTAQGAQTVQEALRYTAGVFADYYGPQSFARDGFVRSRGFFLDQYLDGLKLGQVSQSNSFSWIDPYLIERIEVLKGPSAILYGQVAPGGIYNLISKRPTAVPFREVQFQTGSYDRAQGAFDVGGPIDAAGHFLYRVTGLMRDADTQVDLTKDQRAAIAPALTWRPSVDTSLTILAKYQYDPNMTGWQFMPARGIVSPNGSISANPNGWISPSTFTGEPSFNNSSLEQSQIGYLFEHRFDSVWTVRQNARYMHSNEHDKYVFAVGLVGPALRNVNRFAFLYNADFDRFAMDNQVQAKFNTGALAHTWLVGLDYQYTLLDFNRGTGAAPQLDIFAPVYGQSVATPAITERTLQQQRQLGVYLQDQIKIDNWVLLAGGRHDRAESGTLSRVTGMSTQQLDHAYSGRVGLVYVAENGLAPYASYSTSFEPIAGTFFDGVTPFKPTTAEQYETGVKYQPPGFNAFVTVSVFDLTQQNVQTPDPLHPGFSVQTGAIRSRGAEFEAKASPRDGLNVIAAYGYVDAKVTQSTGLDLGKTPTRTPAHLASLWADYTIQGGALAGLGFGSGVRYLGSSWGDNINTFQVPAVTLVDAAVYYDLEKLNRDLKGWHIAVNTYNLFDKVYVASCTVATSCYFGSRRMVYATTRYRW